MTSQPITPVLAQHVTLRAPHCRPGSVELDALFEYDSRDPFAVWITFGSGAASIRWAMSRSLLAEGLTDPARSPLSNQLSNYASSDPLRSSSPNRASMAVAPVWITGRSCLR